MSIKTIAVDHQVYERLASAKRSGESFSKVIDRLLTQVGEAHTGGDILRRVQEVEPLPAEDVEVFLGVIAESREGETWDQP
jgi:predicted CopG family antitoxin